MNINHITERFFRTIIWLADIGKWAYVIRQNNESRSSERSLLNINYLTYAEDPGRLPGNVGQII